MIWIKDIKKNNFIFKEVIKDVSCVNFFVAHPVKDKMNLSQCDYPQNILLFFKSVSKKTQISEIDHIIYFADRIFFMEIPDDVNFNLYLKRDPT